MDSFLVLTDSKQTIQLLASSAGAEASGFDSAAPEVLALPSVETPAALNAPVNQDTVSCRAQQQFGAGGTVYGVFNLEFWHSEGDQNNTPSGSMK